MYCKNCGNKIPDDSKFCIYCGTNLKEEKSINVDNNSKVYKEQYYHKKSRIKKIINIITDIILWCIPAFMIVIGILNISYSLINVIYIIIGLIACPYVVNLLNIRFFKGKIKKWTQVLFVVLLFTFCIFTNISFFYNNRNPNENKDSSTNMISSTIKKEIETEDEKGQNQNINSISTEEKNRTSEGLLNIEEYPEIKEVCDNYENYLDEAKITYTKKFKNSAYANNTYYITMIYDTESDDSVTLKFDNNQLALINISGSSYSSSNMPSENYINLRLLTISFLNFNDEERHQILDIISKEDIESVTERPNGFSEIELNSWKITVLGDVVIPNCIFSKQ